MHSTTLNNSISNLGRIVTPLILLVGLVACHGIEERDGFNKSRSIEKLGTIAVDRMETSLIVLNGRLYRLEYIREMPLRKPTKPSFFHFVDVETGKTTAPFAEGHHFANGFEDNGSVYVYGVRKGGGSVVDVFWSKDLKNWSSQTALTMPGWGMYNTSVCKGPEGYVMAFEVGASPSHPNSAFKSLLYKF